MRSLVIYTHHISLVWPNEVIWHGRYRHNTDEGDGIFKLGFKRKMLLKRPRRIWYDKTKKGVKGCEAVKYIDLFKIGTSSELLGTRWWNLGFLNGGMCLDWLKNCWLFGNNSAPWSKLKGEETEPVWANQNYSPWLDRKFMGDARHFGFQDRKERPCLYKHRVYRPAL